MNKDKTSDKVRKVISLIVDSSIFLSPHYKKLLKLGQRYWVIYYGIIYCNFCVGQNQ